MGIINSSLENVQYNCTLTSKDNFIALIFHVIPGILINKVQPKIFILRKLEVCDYVLNEVKEKWE